MDYLNKTCILRYVAYLQEKVEIVYQEMSKEKDPPVI